MGLLAGLLGTPTEGWTQPALAVTDAAVTEGNSGTTTVVFTVTLSPAASTVVSFDYSTFDGTASAGLDYASVFVTGQTLAVGQTSLLVPVTVYGDVDPEGNETFSLYLFNEVGATVSDPEGVGTILDDEMPIAVFPVNWGAIKSLFR